MHHHHPLAWQRLSPLLTTTAILLLLINFSPPHSAADELLSLKLAGLNSFTISTSHGSSYHFCSRYTTYYISCGGEYGLAAEIFPPEAPHHWTIYELETGKWRWIQLLSRGDGGDVHVSMEGEWMSMGGGEEVSPVTMS